MIGQSRGSRDSHWTDSSWWQRLVSISTSRPSMGGTVWVQHRLGPEPLPDP